MFPVLAGSNPSGYNLTRSLRFRSSASAYLSRTPASTGNRRTFTFSTWLKRGRFATGTEQVLIAATNPSTSFSEINFAASSDILRINLASGVAAYYFDTSMVFRDPSAWYHLVVAVDTTQASSANWIKTYVNGSQIVGTLVGSFQNYDTDFNTASRPNSIGGRPNLNTWFYDGYQTEIYWIDGQALTPSSFGSTNTLTGVWQPARYAGTYGTNGFYLPFTDNSALTTSSNVGLGKDFSGNGNYWATNNISITAGVTYDSMTDVPTLTSATAANFAVVNPLDKDPSVTVSEGNLAHSTGASWLCSRGSFQIPITGKWYWETTIGVTTSASVGASIGLCTAAAVLNNFNTTGQYAVQAAATGNIYVNGTNQASGLGTFAAGDIIQVAADCTNGKIWIGKNNVFWNSAGGTTGNPSGNTNETINVTPVGMFPFTATYQDTVRYNFGQRPFTYTPPTGFVALNTYNLPTSTILQGNKVMDATLYTGNSSTQTVTNAGAFKPDLVWIKDRSSVAQHVWTDSARGVDRQLFSSLTNAEQTSATGITSLNSNGFSLGVNVSPTGNTNGSPDNFVAWQWQAGQGSTSSNTSGSITSTVSVNASAGFSVVTYTGTNTATNTVGHGLGVAPAIWLIKNRTTAGGNWVYNYIYNNTVNYAFLNSSVAGAAQGSPWSTLPTSSVITLGGSDTNTCAASNNYVMYAWTPIAGYSAFGSYVGNNSNDGPFVYLGFRPKFILFKTVSSGSAWIILDSARDSYNVEQYGLAPDNSNAESTYSGIAQADFLSNGFKIRANNTNIYWNNASGSVNIYMAFAENPFKNSLAR